MNWKRIITLGAAAGGLAALVTSAATTGNRRVVATVENPQSKAAEASGAALDAEIARLRERLHPTTSPQQPARNLFQFTAAPGSRSEASRVTAPVVEPEIESIPAPPPMKLIGIAEDQSANGAVRTAIISGFGELFLVKEGEAVTSRYRVARISSEVVELTDVEDATIVRLALK